MKKARLIVFSMLIVLSLIGPSFPEEVMNKVIVYYFYTDVRCPTCYKLEKYTKSAVETFFTEEIKAGTVQFQAINTDKPENNHFLNDYQLYTKSVVISLVKNGKEQKFKNLPKIWDLVDDEGAFSQYINAETNGYLAEVNL
ncbi:MAG TPA: nitrophenyl compound nitroreductase subunit ArsF family protein [bacterium]|nr:nitrophenyl compound nitroreductase subunit ArsF family protein [bacterium]